MTTGVWVLLAALACVAAIGLAKRTYDGRFRSTATATRTAETPADQDTRLTAEDLGGSGLGERATLVQFSSAFCQPCRATRRILADVEIDAEANLDLVRRLDVMRTPTTLVLDPHGRVATRASGQPRKEQVLAALPV